MLFYCFIVLYFLITLLISISFIQKKTILAISFVLVTFISFLQLTSLFTLGSAVNYPFYVHFIDIESFVIALETEKILSFLAPLIFFFISITLLVFFRKITKKYRIAYLAILITWSPLSSQLLSLYTSVPILLNTLIFSEKQTFILNKETVDADTAFEQFLTENNWDYTRKKDLKVSEGNNKNIVFIYLESLENTYLFSDYYSGKNIAKELFDIKNEKGFIFNKEFKDTSGYTMNAVFSSQCGLPAAFGYAGNNQLKSISNIELSCYNQMLSHIGYRTLFISGASGEFSGRAHFLNKINYETLSREELDSKYEAKGWGVNDLDLLKETIFQIDKLQSQGGAFNLNVLTLGPHPRNGVYDKRCENYVDTYEYKVETMVRCNAYLVKMIVNHLDKIGILDNTLVYIMPDHIAMEGIVNIKKLKQNENRGLWLLTNDSNVEGKKLTQGSMPRIIIDALEIKSNVKFPVDNYNNDEDFINSIKEDKQKYQDFLSILVNKIDISDGFYIERKSNKFIINGDFEFTGSQYFSINNNGIITHDFPINISNEKPYYQDKEKNKKKLFIRLLRDGRTNIYFGMFNGFGGVNIESSGRIGNEIFNL